MEPTQRTSAIVERHKLVATTVKTALEDKKPLLVSSLPGTGKEALIKGIAKENGIDLKIIELAGEATPSDIINFTQVKSMERNLQSRFAEGDCILIDVGVINDNTIMPLLNVLEAMKNLNMQPIVECSGKVLLEACAYPDMNSLLENVATRVDKNYQHLAISYKAEMAMQSSVNIAPVQDMIINDKISKGGMLDKIKSLKMEGLGNTENSTLSYKS